MTEKTLQRLQFHEAFEYILSKLPSEGARERFIAQGFAKDLQDLQERQALLEDAIELQLKHSPLPRGPLYSLEEDLLAASKGRSFIQEHFLPLMDTLRTIRSVETFIKEKVEQGAIRKRYEYEIYSFQTIEDSISRVFNDDGTIKDNATPELSRITKSILSLEGRVRDKMNSYTSDSSIRDYLQDNIISMRGDRYVIPVKAEHRRRVPGMLHDRSASGSTLYIEPTAIVEMNNELRELQLEKHQEIRRIIADLSRRVGERAADMVLSLNSAQWILTYFSLANDALDRRLTICTTGTREVIDLKNARHPLLDPKTVVPMSMHLEEDRTLIITGPNTGGKTVTLKTVGLLALLNQYGLAIPADSGSKLPFFQQIYADIGDEQSIEQSLSTFSSHMVNIIEILEVVGDQDLVLLDELGAGTDPQEGAALAQAILTNLREKDPFVLATSHYSEIKQFAMKNPGYANASVEFDIKSLSPTYKLLMGVPGSSNAFLIAKRLGMKDIIIDRAKVNLDESSIQLEEVLLELETKRKEYQDTKDAIEQELTEANKLKERYEQRLDKLEESRDKLLSKAKQEARDLLKKADEEAKAILKHLRSMSKEDLDFSEMEESAKRLRDKRQELAPREEKKKVNPPKKLSLGDQLYVPKLDNRAQVIELPDENGNFRAMVGILKMTLHISEVEKVKDTRKEWIPKVTGDRVPSQVKTKLDLRGKNSDDARIEIDQFIDQAVMGRAESVEIIHGKGTGVLREFVKQYLKRHPNVASYRLGGYHEGGDGVTIVTLK